MNAFVSFSFPPEKGANYKKEMSAFDRRVLQWLDHSTVSEKAKLTVLNRVSAGIDGYRTIPLDAAGTKPLNIDFALQDSINKAVRKLESGEECPKGSLFPNLGQQQNGTGKQAGSSSRPATARSGTAQSSTARGSARTGTPASSARKTTTSSSTGNQGTASNRRTSGQASKDKQGSGEPKKSSSFRKNNDGDAGDSPSTPTGGQNAAFAAFSFGTPAEDQEPQENHNPDEELPDAEDRRRRRLTLAKRASRNAVSAEVLHAEDHEDYDMPVTAKPADITRRIVKTLEKHHLFSHLDDKDLVHIAGVMSLLSIKKGEKLVTQGKECDIFSIIVTGSCLNKTKQNQKLNIGACINEVGLMYDNKSEDTIEAAMAMTQVCQLTRKAYQIICAKASQAKRARYEGFLSKLKFLSGLEPGERLQLADSLKSASYHKGDYLIRYGEQGEWFQIILEGTVKVVGRNEAGEPVDVCTFGEGDCIGELEFLFKHNTVADCIADSEVVKTAKMTTFHFEKVIGSAKEVLERKAHDDEVYGYYRQKKEEMDAKRNKAHNTSNSGGTVSSTTNESAPAETASSS